MNPMDLKRGIDLAVTEAVADLKRRSKKIKTSEEIAQVGSIAANGEKMIGEKIAEAMQKVGNEGVITVEESKALEFELESRRGHAVRPRLPLALLHHQRREDDHRARGPLHPPPREEALEPAGACCRSSRRSCSPASRCSSSPRTSRARRLPRSSSTSSAAASRSRR